MFLVLFQISIILVHLFFKDFKKKIILHGIEIDQSIKTIKITIISSHLPYLRMLNPQALMIVKTNASNISYGVILKEKLGE